MAKGDTEKQALHLYAQLARNARATEKAYVEKLQDSEDKAGTQELQDLASSLKDRVDALQEKLGAGSKLSMVQAMYPAVMTHPNPSRTSLVGLIMGLDEELTSLETKLNERGMMDNDEEAKTATSVENDGRSARRAKRPRVSLP